MVLLKKKLFAIFDLAWMNLRKGLLCNSSGKSSSRFSVHFTKTLLTAQALNSGPVSFIVRLTLGQARTSSPRISFMSSLKGSFNSVALLRRKLTSS